MNAEVRLSVVDANALPGASLAGITVNLAIPDGLGGVEIRTVIAPVPPVIPGQRVNRVRFEVDVP